MEPVASWRGACAVLAKGLESKRAEFEQPAAAMPIRAGTATRSQTRKRDVPFRHGMWLLTHTQQE